jgi:hypothetical protein
MKILVATDGREWSGYVVQQATQLDKEGLETCGCFDGVTEFELLGEIPDDEEQVALYTKDATAKLVVIEDYNAIPDVDESGFQLCSTGHASECLVVGDAALREFLDGI